MELGFILKHLLWPPGGLLLLMVLGWWLWANLERQRWGTACLAVGVGGLWLLCMPLTVQQLSRWIEPAGALTPAQWPQLAEQAQAIVVLGAGRQLADPGWAEDQPSLYALERLRYGARIHRASGLPVLISGGGALALQSSEAALMASVLQQDFAVEPRWLEARSRTTWENAQFSAALLKNSGIDTVVLVTHALHMPRARWSFQQAGLEVIEAPLSFFSAPSTPPLGGVLPEAKALWQNSLLLHEIVGAWVYRWRY